MRKKNLGPGFRYYNRDFVPTNILIKYRILGKNIFFLFLQIPGIRTYTIRKDLKDPLLAVHLSLLSYDAATSF